MVTHNYLLHESELGKYIRYCKYSSVCTKLSECNLQSTASLSGVALWL